jgi:nitrite reductase (NADH) large subunit
MTPARQQRRHRKRLLVVGNGMAGLRLLEEVLALAPDRFEITVIGAEPEPAYNRVLLSSLLAGEIGADDVEMRPRAWYAEQGIALRTSQPAVALDTVARQLVLRDGEVLPFDACVLATGSEPIRLALPGNTLAGVMTFRTLADVAYLEGAAANRVPAVVIGGGLLGIEAAYGLARAGVPVTLVHLMDRLMERQLDAEGARLLKGSLEAQGIRVLLQAQTRAVHGASSVESVELQDGQRIACGLVVMAVGVRANTALAESAGLPTRRGILVDDRLQTAVPDVYAIGDCIEHAGACYGLVEPAYEHARIVARTLCGEAATYSGSVLATNLKVSGVPVFSAGDFEGAGAESIVVRDEVTPAYRKLVVRDGRLAGVVLVGDTHDALWYAELIRSQTPIAPIRDALAFGEAFAEAA